jgi:hypothetical protein
MTSTAGNTKEQNDSQTGPVFEVRSTDATQYVLFHTPEDGNRTCIRNFVFFSVSYIIPDDEAQTPRLLRWQRP